MPADTVDVFFGRKRVICVGAIAEPKAQDTRLWYKSRQAMLEPRKFLFTPTPEQGAILFSSKSTYPNNTGVILADLCGKTNNMS